MCGSLPSCTYSAHRQGHNPSIHISVIYWIYLIFSNYSTKCFLIFFYVFFCITVFLFCVFSCFYIVFLLFCILFLLLFCLFPISVQVYQPLPPVGDPNAVNKYHIVYIYIYIFYTTETRGLMVAALVQPKYVAIYNYCNIEWRVLTVCIRIHAY
jgi:hypothetical protein